jgi:hypothetical protein
VSWIPIAVWAGAAALALVVLGFCSYELVWKSNRLRADLARLQQANDQLATLRSELTQAAHTAQALSGPRSATPGSR